MKIKFAKNSEMRDRNMQGGMCSWSYFSSDIF